MYTEVELRIASTASNLLAGLKSWLLAVYHDLRLLPAGFRLRPRPTATPGTRPATQTTTPHEDQIQSYISRISSLESDLATLRLRLSQEAARAQEAMAHAAAATSSAADWQSRYLQEVSDHIRDIKSTTNWFAQTTSARTPMFDGAGPTRPLPDGPDGLAGFPGAVGRTRASVAAREKTQRTLEELEKVEYQKLQEALAQDGDGDGGNDVVGIPPMVSDEQVKSLWSQVMGPDAQYPELARG